jgi:hypothetical protein
MIQENALDLHGYATLILCDGHGEYPLPHPKGSLSHYRVELFYDAFEVDRLREHLDLTNAYDESFAPFPGLQAKYNGHYEPGHDIWMLRGDVAYLMGVYHAYALIVEEGPSCHSDDDCFDYWPSAMDMLIVLAKDIAELAPDTRPTLGDYLITAMSKTTAKCGDVEDWHPIWDEIRTFTNTHPV